MRRPQGPKLGHAIFGYLYEIENDAGIKNAASYFMATGRPPFDSNALPVSGADIMDGALQANMCAHIPRQLSAECMKCYSPISPSKKALVTSLMREAMGA